MVVVQGRMTVTVPSIPTPTLYAIVLDTREITGLLCTSLYSFMNHTHTNSNCKKNIYIYHHFAGNFPVQFMHEIWL